MLFYSENSSDVIDPKYLVIFKEYSEHNENIAGENSKMGD